MKKKVQKHILKTKSRMYLYIYIYIYFILFKDILKLGAMI